MDWVIKQVKEAIVNAGSTFSAGLKQAYCRAISAETNALTGWGLETLLENALLAEKNRSPLCDDTGIPHLFIEIGKNRALDGATLEAIYVGVAQGLSELPGRPMNINGTDSQRIDQSGGLSPDPSAVMPAPLLVKMIEDPDILRVHVLLLGGGPSIRAKTYRIYHRRSVERVKDEIVEWATESVKLLGCTPATLAIGIGRSHYEAAALMIEAQVYGRHDKQNAIEKEITERVNKSNVGVLGLGGETSVLATFVNVGPQRASGVRIVCMRPCCCVEPRLTSLEL
ncbi:MAG: fumarate hydratase [Clostridiaceae bacterium]|nr:fumarate hydratase [Clostridiaceae bacterium]